MIGSEKIAFVIGRRKHIAAVAGLLVLFGTAAIAQENKPDPAPAAREATPDYQPGMLDSVGRWFKDSFNRLGTNVEGARESLGGLSDRAGDAAKEAADAAREAAEAAKEAVAKFPNARMVDGSERCAVSANGGPDCRKAAAALCKAKGFSSGSSLEIQSAQKCPARVWISGRPAEPGDCGVQAFVTRAMCQ